MTQKPHKFNRYGLLALAVALAAMLTNQTPLRAATPSDVSRAIWVYWDKDANGIYGTGDVGLGGQLVYLNVFPCDPNAPDCVQGVDVLDGYTEANGQALFSVPDDTWGVFGCYGGQGCLMSPGAIAFAVLDGQAVYLPEVAR